MKEYWKKHDRLLAFLFLSLTAVFVIAAMAVDPFLQWAFERHHNILSWYIRPLFLIPFCYFAYKRSWSGISATIFGIMTSMIWFPAPVPSEISSQVQEFLAFEVDYLTGEWGAAKAAIAFLIPASFLALGLAFWKRNLWIGLSVVAFMAVAKIIWSVGFAGSAGTSILIPAIFGLLLCLILIYWGFKRMESRAR